MLGLHNETRHFRLLVLKTKKSLSATCDDANAEMNKARAGSFPQHLAAELLLVHNRVSWLSSVLSNDRDPLAKLKADMTKQVVQPLALADKNTSNASTDDSRDLSVFATCGPCLGWEKLVSLDEWALASSEIKLESSEDVDKLWQEQAPINNVFNELRKAVLDSVQDLKNANSGFVREAQNASKQSKRPGEVPDDKGAAASAKKRARNIC